MNEPGDIREMTEYLGLRRQIVNGDLFLLRNELIHLLYKLYLKVVRVFYMTLETLKSRDETNTRQYTNIKKQVQRLIALKKDFADIPTYIKDADYILPILEAVPPVKDIQKDNKAREILLNQTRTKVSQYTFEILMALTEKYNYKTVENLFFYNTSKSINAVPQLEVIKDLQEVVLLNTGMTTSDRDTTNTSPYDVGLAEKAFEFGLRLDESYWAKVNAGLVKSIDGSSIELGESKEISYVKRNEFDVGGELVKTEK